MTIPGRICVAGIDKGKLLKSEAGVRAPHCGSKPQPNLLIVAEEIAVLEKQQQRQRLSRGGRRGYAEGAK
jgi:hypothetical protein